MRQYIRDSFFRRVVIPARTALGGLTLHQWIEVSADTLLANLTVPEFLDLGRPVADKLRISMEFVDNSHPLLRENPLHWTANIDLRLDNHQLRVKALIRPSNRKALVAHEFGHAMLYNNRDLWIAISKSSLFIDSAQERLADDISRAILLPRKILLDAFAPVLGTAVDPAELGMLFGALVKCVKIPVSVVIARLLQVWGRDHSVAIQVSIPTQMDLNIFPRKRRRASPSTRCLVSYSNESREGETYPFLEVVRINKVLSWELVERLDKSISQNNPVSSELVNHLISPSSRVELRDLSFFIGFKFCDEDGVQQIVVLSR